MLHLLFTFPQVQTIKVRKILHTVCTVLHQSSYLDFTLLSLTFFTFFHKYVLFINA